MRTTLTVDDRVVKAIKELAHSSGKSFKQVVNESLERGLATSVSSRKEPCRERPTRLGEVRAGNDLTKAVSLAAALEDEKLTLRGFD